MVDGLTITKSANKTVWADGLLTYTIVVKNETAEAYTNAVLTDVLDTALVTFKDGTNATASEYSYSGSTLTVNVGDISSSGEKTVTFHVSKQA